MEINQNFTDDRCESVEASTRKFWEMSSSVEDVECMQCMITSEGVITIHVIQSDEVNWRERNDFILMFCEKIGKKIMQHMTADYRNISRIKLDHVNELTCHSYEYFEKLLSLYREDVKSLRLNVKLCKWNTFMNKTFINLERLEIIGDYKTYPLSVLRNGSDIFHIQDTLIAPTLKMDWDKLLRMSASYMYIHIGELSIDNILGFISLWSVGNLHRDIRACIWSLVRKEFDVIQLLRSLGASEQKVKKMIQQEDINDSSTFLLNDFDECILIEHQIEKETFARLTYTKNKLKFLVL